MPRYELVEGRSSKFWEVTLSGSTVQTRWGRIGSQGQAKEERFDTVDGARKAQEKLIESKLKKGYREAKGTQPAKAVALGKPSASKGPKEKAPKSYMNVDGIEARFGIELPARLRSFISTREYARYDKLSLSNLPNVDSESSEQTFTVSFDDPANTESFG